MSEYAFTVTEQLDNARTLVFTYVRIGTRLLADMSVYSAGENGIERRTVMNVNMLATLREAKPD